MTGLARVCMASGLALLLGCSRDAAEKPVAAGADSAASTEAGASDLPVLWKGDLDGMIARGRIRVLVTLSRTDFFIDRGTVRGLTHDRFAEFEKELNQKLAKQKGKHVAIVYIPVARDQLLPGLVEGRGDIAAANLSITAARSAVVDFSDPLRTGVSEVLVSGPAGGAPRTLADLGGREVYVRKSSSYFESLQRVNDSLKHAGLKPIKVRLADEHLEDEDILEMVNVGVMPATIVDNYVAGFWDQVFDSLVVHPAIAVATGDKLAWAMRKDSPQLRAAVDAFTDTHAKGSSFGNIVDHRYWKDAGYVTNPASEKNLAQFRAMIDIFHRYGDKFGFDHLLLAAQGYQESGLDQSARSRVGAIGVMQVTPETAADPNVNVRGIEQLEPNIHAGSKYMRFLADRYFAAEPMDSLNRTLFAFASYNAGPARVAKLRAEAKTLGLDPNVWFGNVEVVAARDIGRETVTYVRNIYKYYVAYVLVAQQQAARRTAEAAEPRRK